MKAFIAIALSVMFGLSAVPAGAENCGTIVIPPGLGVGPGADVTSFNPLFIDSLYNEEAADLIFEQLLWIDRAHKIDWSRSIASSVTTPDNGKTYDIALRPWLWSDGVQVTSADVLYAYRLIKAYGTSYAGYGSGGIPDLIASVTAPDAEHVVVTLTRPVNPQWFILNGLVQLQPLPEHAWSHDSTDEIWQQQSNPKFFAVVDGPLEIKRLDVGLDAEFVPNPRYGGAKMQFDRFIMKFENSEAQELQAVQSGELDVSNIPFDLFDKAAHLPGDRVVTLSPSYSWHELIPNLANPATPFFKDVRVRDAIADAINQAQIIRLAMHGHGEAVHGPVPPVPDTFLSPQAKAGDYPVGYDPTKARKILSEAGFTPGPDGVLQRDGKRLAFTLEIPAGQPLRIEMAEVIQQDLAAVGIAMQVHQVEFNQMMEQMISERQSWEAILIAESLSAYPSGEGLFKHGAFYNDNGYSNAEMDRLITASTDTPGLDGLYAYQDFASAQQPVIFLPNDQYSLLANKRLHGLDDFIDPLGYWAPEKLFCTAP